MGAAWSLWRGPLHLIPGTHPHDAPAEDHPSCGASQDRRASTPGSSRRTGPGPHGLTHPQQPPRLPRTGKSSRVTGLPATGPQQAASPTARRSSFGLQLTAG